MQLSLKLFCSLNFNTHSILFHHACPSFLILDTVMLLESRIRDISRVLLLACNSVYLVCLVEDAIPHVYKMEGH